MTITAVLVAVGTSLVATGIGAVFGWVINQKRQSDEVTNKIERITNDIRSIKDQMVNGFEGVNNRFDRVSNEMETILREFNKLSVDHEGLTQKVGYIENSFASSIAKIVSKSVDDSKPPRRIFNDDDVSF